MSGSIQERVRQCLREGQSTTSEVAAIVGIPLRNACARLRYMEARGQAERIGKVGKAILWRTANLAIQLPRRKRPSESVKARVEREAARMREAARDKVQGRTKAQWEAIEGRAGACLRNGLAAEDRRARE